MIWWYHNNFLDNLDETSDNNDYDINNPVDDETSNGNVNGSNDNNNDITNDAYNHNDANDIKKCLEW